VGVGKLRRGHVVASAAAPKSCNTVRLAQHPCRPWAAGAGGNGAALSSVEAEVDATRS